MSYSKLEIRNLDIGVFVPSASNTYQEPTQFRIRNRRFFGPVLEVLKEGYRGTKYWVRAGEEPIYFSLVKEEVWNSVPPKNETTRKGG